MSKPLKLFAVLSVLTLLAGGWLYQSGLLARFGSVADSSTATCKDLDAMNTVEGTLVMSKLILVYIAKAGKTPSDEETDAIGTAIAAACAESPDMLLQDIVVKFAEAVKTQSP